MIKEEFVPDRRVQIFDFEVSQDGTKIIGETSNKEAYQRTLELQTNYPGVNLDSFVLSEPVGQALVNVSVCNIRSAPKHSAELVTQSLMGQPLLIWKEKGSWVYIQAIDQYFGWVDRGAITELNKDDMGDYANQNKVMYTSDFGICYKAPDENSNIVSDLVAGNILIASGKEKNYTKVVFPDGRNGFVPAQSVKKISQIVGPSAPDWTELEATARRFMGRPYLWGGTSGKGVDCSGFTKMVYYLHGLILPRDASQQVRSGKNVSIDNLDNLRPGDFLFFGKKGKNGEKDRVTHVAIHIGNGKIIHSSEKVRIESLNPNDEDYNSHRRETLLSAKRMISNNSINEGVLQLNENKIYEVF